MKSMKPNIYNYTYYAKMRYQSLTTSRTIKVLSPLLRVTLRVNIAGNFQIFTFQELELMNSRIVTWQEYDATNIWCWCQILILNIFWNVILLKLTILVDVFIIKLVDLYEARSFASNSHAGLEGPDPFTLKKKVH